MELYVKYVPSYSSSKNVCTNIVQCSVHLVKRIEKQSIFLQMFIGIVKAVRIRVYIAIAM